MLVLALILLGQLLVYALVIWLLARLFQRFEPVAQWSILIACVIVGIVSGFLTVLLWPRLDSILYPNVLAFVIGEQIYAWATGSVPPGTPSPHFAIPWILRIPQLFVLTSLLLLALFGLIVQLIANNRQSPRL